MEDDDESKKKQNQFQNEESISEAEAHLDFELTMIRKMRLAFTATLKLLEAVRDDLGELGHRMDRLTAASRRCRTLLLEKKRIERDYKLDEAGGSKKRLSKRTVGNSK